MRCRFRRLFGHRHPCATDEHGGHVVNCLNVFEGVAAHGHEVGILARLERAGGGGDWTRPWGWSSGSTSGAGSEPTRSIKVSSAW
jgi:hypothetical protein